VLLQVVGDASDSHPVDARTTLIGFHPSQCFFHVLSITYLLHQSSCSSWAFGCIHRLWRFSLFSARFAGFTRWRDRKVQFDLNVLLHFAPEIHVLLASPLVRAFNPRFRLGLSVFLRLSTLKCLTSLADDMAYYAFC